MTAVHWLCERSETQHNIINCCGGLLKELTVKHVLWELCFPSVAIAPVKIAGVGFSPVKHQSTVRGGGGMSSIIINTLRPHISSSDTTHNINHHCVEELIWYTVCCNLLFCCIQLPAGFIDFCITFESLKLPRITFWQTPDTKTGANLMHSSAGHIVGENNCKLKRVFFFSRFLVATFLYNLLRLLLVEKVVPVLLLVKIPLGIIVEKSVQNGRSQRKRRLF